MTIDAVCFDLDDTLFDYQRYARAGLESAADCLESQTGRRYHEELLDIYFEDGVVDGTFDVLVERHDLSSVAVADLIEAYHGASGPLPAYPETKSVLSRLSEEYRLGLITDGRGGHEKLRRLGIHTFFESVLVTPTIERSKHEPIVFERVLSELSVPPERTVYVGDDPRVDFRVPNDLGMVTVRLRRGRYTDLEPATEAAGPDYEVQRLDELGAVIARAESVVG